LTDAACIDSDKLIDATSPDGSRINVTFAGNQAMNLRCYWDILTDPISYYGKFSLVLIAKMEGTTDTATVRVMATDESNTIGMVLERDVIYTEWALYDGWEILSYRIGTADDDLLAAGNSLRISIFASTDGTPTDDLHIAGAFLVPVDEAYCCGAAPNPMAGTTDFILKQMDGDRGLFAYSSATTRYFPNFGVVGTLPLLSPEVENYIYFVTSNISIGLTLQAYTLTDAYHVSLTYRPRGIFLRGSNP